VRRKALAALAIAPAIASLPDPRPSRSRTSRSFVRRRATALALFGCVLLAVAVSFGLLVLGAPLSS
jgi:hypothetical protein